MMASVRVTNRRVLRRLRGALILWIVTIGLGCGLEGCAIDGREFGSPDAGVVREQGNILGTGGSAGQGADARVRPVLGAALGAACGGANECDSGFCVDGVCCNTGCAEVCASCNSQGTEGTCSPTASDELCSALRCPADTECRSLDVSQLGSNCEGVGACRKNAACEVTNFQSGTACQNGTGACTGDGACAVEGKLLLGAACAADDQCAEGHCVANTAGELICCDATCDGECQACSPAGHCEATPANDPRCPSIACPVDNVCRDYEGDLTDNLCRGFGLCALPYDCTYGELRSSADCNCDAAGGCTLLRGAECTDDGECASGACVETDGGRRVCCASACGAGLTCAPDGWGCIECNGSQVSCDGSVELRCGADGLFARNDCEYGCTPDRGCSLQPGVGLPCSAGACAAPLICQADVTGEQRCCARDCAAEGRLCAANGSCVCGPDPAQSEASCLLRAGDPCAEAGECESGQCVDGVCCQEGCEGACERCEAGSGACVAVAAAQQEPLCNGGRECGGARGDCRLRLLEQCTVNTDCSTGNCGLSIAGGQRCCAVGCSGNTTCSSDGLRCVECEATFATSCGNGCDAQESVCNPLRPIGATCALPQQCAAPGLCLIDSTNVSRCCEANCAAQGKLCDTSGQCVCPPNQVDVAGQCRSQDGQTCSDNTNCSSNLCELIVGGGKRCCAEDCSATELCAADGSACVDQRGALGAPCATGADCQNSNCVNGVCCAGTCGACQRCGQATGLCQADPSAACTLASGIPGDCNAAGQCTDPGVGPGQLCNARPCQAGLVCTASGVCCASLCNGACESACSAGSATCNTPTTDARCGQVQCTSPQCQTSRPLQTNRSCLGPGVCAPANADQCSAPTAITGACTLGGGGAGECRNGTCAVPLRNTGAACTQDTQCLSGFCTDGVCCGSRCNGVCTQCQAGTGTCLAPADDVACNDVSCPGTECRSGTTLTTNMCRSAGQCKTAADCPTGAPLADGSACAGSTGLRTCFNGICNNSPAVSCGGAIRPITAAMICCESRDRGQFSGTAVEFYTTVANCPATALDLVGTTPVTCDGSNDCPAGEVCCASSGRASSAIECLPAASCHRVDGGSTSFSIVCGSPGGTRGTCPAGSTCTANANLGAYVAGWSLCSIPF